MTCNELEALCIPYLDGKLPPHQLAVVEAHVSGCGDCSARLRELAVVSRVLDEWQAPAPSPWFDARLRHRIAMEPAPPLWPNWLPAWSPTFSLSVAVLLFAAMLVIWTGGGQNALPPAQMVTVEKTDEVIHAVQEVDMLADFELLGELPRGSRRDTQENGRQ